MAQRGCGRCGGSCGVDREGAWSSGSACGIRISCIGYWSAKWAAQSIDLGGGNRFTPLVLGPSGVPAVTEEEVARQGPELAVLSAMAHGKDADVERTVRIATAAMLASVGLDAERSTLYFDLVEAALSEAARRALQSMDPAKYEYQSEFARRYFAQGMIQGEAKGKAEGQAELVLKLLALRFGTLPAGAEHQVRRSSVAELEQIAERMLTANTIDEVLGDQ